MLMANDHMPTTAPDSGLRIRTEVKTQAAGQPGPIGVRFLDAHLTFLERRKDLGCRVGVERGLEGELELANVYVVLDRFLTGGGESYVPGDADLGVQLAEVA